MVETVSSGYTDFLSRLPNHRYCCRTSRGSLSINSCELIFGRGSLSGSPIAGMQVYRVEAGKLAETWLMFQPLGSAWADAMDMKQGLRVQHTNEAPLAVQAFASATSIHPTGKIS